MTSPYRLARVRAFFDPDAATAAGWQSYQSLVAIGSGGITGRGYGTGLQKLFFLPEPHTDFIFSITGEELGLAWSARSAGTHRAHHLARPADRVPPGLARTGPCSPSV